MAHVLAARDSACVAGNSYDGRMGVRISSVFVILVTSTFGAVFPVLSRPRPNRPRFLIPIPAWAFFIAKFFGSGVIIATAFIHLLASADSALTEPCLGSPWTDYSWAEGIALMTLIVLFFVELVVMRFANIGHSHVDELDRAGAFGNDATPADILSKQPEKPAAAASPAFSDPQAPSNGLDLPHGVDHLGHAREHADNPDTAENGHSQAEVSGAKQSAIESYTAQLTAVFVLEFGVLFHSVFVGLTLAVAGQEFTTLYIVLVFHQTFEGLGLGSRLAEITWPESKRWTPYLCGLGYGITTPIAIAIGLGVRNSYAANAKRTLVTSGVFDAISGGILLYTALVELMAHEFMFSPSMRHASFTRVLLAFFLLCLGAGLMALLGYWA